MSRLPRLAVGTTQPEWPQFQLSAAAIRWGLLGALEQAGVRVQRFQSRASLEDQDGATVITGLASRHLDSWLMGPSACRDAILRGTPEDHTAIVEGQFASARPLEETVGGRLETLCQWLDLPAVAIVDIGRLSSCCMPQRPAASALLLDRVPNHQSKFFWQTLLESLWGLPVLGSLAELPACREEIAGLAPGVKPPMSLCRELGECFASSSDIARLVALSESRPFAYRRNEAEHIHREPESLRIAIAYDEAIGSYFPDTLDLLEARGATLLDFSPLADERLPPEVDIVYVGCGHPESYARELVENHCLIAALREHVCHGRRLYAESGGLAYLCQHIVLEDGSRLPMTGVLPAIARRETKNLIARSVEVNAREGNWLFDRGQCLRGYLTPHWSIEAPGAWHVYGEAPASGILHPTQVLVGRHQAIGSRMHLNLAADPTLIDRFFAPHAPVCEVPVAVTRA